MPSLRSVVLGVAFVAVVVRGGMAQGPTAANPHGALAAALDCGDCHSETGWKPAKRPLVFEHDRQTAFPLTGRHEDAACGTCHLGLRFDEPKLAEGECGSCHVDVHQGNLSENCVTCHTTVTFAEVAGLAVHARTSFPLTGAHLQVSCESCHANDLGGAYTTLDTDCLACHQENYTEAASVDHAALQFSTNCTECHGTLGWGGSGGDFDHVTVANGFALLGAHAAIRCESCHVVPGLAPLFPGASQDDCISCHQGDYDREHAGTGFPTDCLACHTVDAWSGGEFVDHDSHFPIFSGPHRSKWDTCQMCHSVAGDFTAFTCFNCHEHDRSRMDDKHREVGGYVYESTACYSCHPDGRKGD
jgi:hypothetical protein